MNDLNLITILATLVYGAIGFALFMLSLWIMEKLTPYSLEKKITEENNIAMGIVMGAVIVALGLIYASVLD